jgi:hypothetical protein
MKYRRLDDNHDYAFGASETNIASDRDAVAQAIYTRLKLLYAEWWEDMTDGLPLWQSILGVRANPKNKEAIDIIIKARILDTLKVSDVSSFSSSFDSETRKYSFSCVVDTAYGQVPVEDVTI